MESRSVLAPGHRQSPRRLSATECRVRGSRKSDVGLCGGADGLRGCAVSPGASLPRGRLPFSATPVHPLRTGPASATLQIGQGPSLRGKKQLCSKELEGEKLPGGTTAGGERRAPTGANQGPGITDASASRWAAPRASLFQAPGPCAVCSGSPRVRPGRALCRLLPLPLPLPQTGVQDLHPLSPGLWHRTQGESSLGVCRGFLSRGHGRAGGARIRVRVPVPRSSSSPVHRSIAEVCRGRIRRFWGFPFLDRTQERCMFSSLPDTRGCQGSQAEVAVAASRTGQHLCQSGAADLRPEPELEAGEGRPCAPSPMCRGEHQGVQTPEMGSLHNDQLRQTRVSEPRLSIHPQERAMLWPQGGNVHLI